jgi:uncharacterized protein YjcR
MPDKAEEAAAVRPGNEGHIESVIRELYLEKRHSDQEIADALGVNRVTVTKWRKRWGIDRDDRPAVQIGTDAA